MLYLDLKPLFKARGIQNPYRYLVQNGFTNGAANQLVYTEKRFISFEQMEKLCEVLVCEPNDLFVWKPKAGVIYPPEFPLHKLKKSPIADEWMDVVAAMPLDKLKALAKEVVERSSEVEGKG